MDKGEYLTDLVVFKDKCLLFVEDDLTIQKNMLDIFGLIFAKVIIAQDGQEGLEKYVDEVPDIIITDIKMEILDGLKFIEEIRKNDFHTPIVIFSSYSDQQYLLKALNLNIDAYMIKPVKLENIINVLSKCAKKINHYTKNIVKLNHNTVYYRDLSEIEIDDQKIVLTYKENLVLELLVKHHPKIVTKDELKTVVWKNDEISESAIKNVIMKLRNKIGSSNIIAVPSSGWRLLLE